MRGRGVTIDGLALCQIAVLLACEEGVAVASHNTLNVASADVEEETFRHLELLLVRILCYPSIIACLSAITLDVGHPQAPSPDLIHVILASLKLPSVAGSCTLLSRPHFAGTVSILYAISIFMFVADITTTLFKQLQMSKARLDIESSRWSTNT